MTTLNDQQLRAVGAGNGPVMIVAGPGTGKTKTLTERITHLLATGTPAQNILALTFTKKAAQEMAERVGDTRVKIATFHALCHDLLGGDKQFVTEPQRLAIVKSLAKPASLKHLSTRELALSISRAKNMQQADDALQKVIAQYNAALEHAGCIDFDDLLVQTKTLLQTNATQRAAIQKRFTHILVDEFQDTNKLQYELLLLIRGNDNIFVIGDPLQSIYGFRGASGDIFEQFRVDFPKVRQITLSVNYRSTQSVVAVSNALFGGGLQADARQSGHVQAVKVLNEYSEATWIINEIQRTIGGSDFHRAVSDDEPSAHRTLGDFAILYRSRSAARAMQQAIEASGLPYQIVGDGSPYDEPVVQTLITLLRACHTHEPVAIKGFTLRQCAVLLDRIDTVQPPADIAQLLAKAFGIELTKPVRQLISTLVRFNNVTQAVTYFDTIAERGFYDPQASAITLLTIHASKGLEFVQVFVIGCEEGILPNNKADVLEEKRLFYVAVTRAKEKLSLTHAAFRAAKPAKQSRFISEVADSILPKIQDTQLHTDARRAAKRQAKRAQTSLF